jgi:hypothetical protein
VSNVKAARRDWLDSISQGGEWWKQSTPKVLLATLALLVKAGVSEEQAQEAIADVVSAMREEYGE